MESNNINSLYQSCLDDRKERQTKENAAFDDWLSISPENSAELADACEKAASSMRAKREGSFEKELENARAAAEGEVLKRHAGTLPDKYKKDVSALAKSLF